MARRRTPPNADFTGGRGYGCTISALYCAVLDLPSHVNLGIEVADPLVTRHAHR